VSEGVEGVEGVEGLNVLASIYHISHTTYHISHTPSAFHCSLYLSYITDLVTVILLYTRYTVFEISVNTLCVYDTVA
jgi:hypothetical protein